MSKTESYWGRILMSTLGLHMHVCVHMWIRIRANTHIHTYEDIHQGNNWKYLSQNCGEIHLSLKYLTPGKADPKRNVLSLLFFSFNLLVKKFSPPGVLCPKPLKAWITIQIIGLSWYSMLGFWWVDSPSAFVSCNCEPWDTDPSS